MRYRPTSCEGCGRVELLLVDGDAERATRCPTCGGIARIVPGCVYAEGDIPLFSEMSRVVALSAVMPSEAQRLVIDIERACARGDVTAGFRRIGSRLSALEPVRLMLDVYPERQKQALIMLATVLNASTLKQRSGTMLAQGASVKRSPRMGSS
jgi:hypothetical protein